jgi:hypothetical protein
LTNIDTFHSARMQNQLPGRVKARLSGLGLPEFQIEGKVQDLEIESVAEVGLIDAGGIVQAVSPVEPAMELPENVVAFPGNTTRH